MTIHPDWSVDLPHDVDSERIAVRLGSGLSCVTLADRLMPQVRRALEISHRRRWPLMEWDTEAFRWGPGSTGPRLGSSTNPWVRADGIRSAIWSPYDAAPPHDLSTHLVCYVLSQLRDPEEDAACPAALTDPIRVQPTHDYPSADAAEILWLAGYGPEALVATHDRLAVDGAPLPLDLLLALTEFHHDLDDLALLRRHGPTTLVKLLISGLDWDAPGVAAEADQLLTLGVCASDVQALLCGPAPADRIRAATRFGEWHPAAAGRVLAQWRRHSHDPSWAQLRALRIAGHDPAEVPDDTMVADFADRLAIGRTEAALSLALAANLAGERLREASFKGIRSFDNAYALFHPDLAIAPSQPTLTELNDLGDTA